MSFDLSNFEFIDKKQLDQPEPFLSHDNILYFHIKGKTSQN